MNEPLPEYMVVGEGHSTLVFLHGLGGDHTNWQPQFAEFASDYRCVAWTLPGYGLSPPLEALTWPNLSDMLARVLDDIGVDRATIVGISMGGYIAQQFAADYDERVDRLVLAATSSEFGRGSASFSERFLAARLKPLDDGSNTCGLGARCCSQWPPEFRRATRRRHKLRSVHVSYLGRRVSSGTATASSRGSFTEPSP